MERQGEASPVSASPRRRGFWVYSFFILSGMCGLVYEVTWDRYLIGFIGATTYAHTVVLTTFMGGLALGSWLFGRFSDRVLNGMRFYGWLEVGIGMYAAVFPYLFETLGSFYVTMAQPFYPQIAGLTFVRFVLCAAVLLPPAALMGGTLPVLAHFLTDRRSSLRPQISFLYAANSGGAVLGTYLAGFWFIAEWGMPLTLVGVGMINVGLGLSAVGMSRFFPPGERVEETTSSEDPDSALYSQREVNVAVLVAGVCGAVTMALEVAWVRFWGLVLGSSTYSFSLMLMAFIAGIAFGSAIVGTRLARRRLTPILFWAFFGTGAILLLGLPFYDRVPYWLARLRLWFADTHESYLAYQFLVFLGCFLMMFVPTLLSGMALPAAIRIASRTVHRLGRDVGRVYAINTVGTLFGSMICGLVLLSWLGLENTFRALFIVYLAAAAVVWLGGEKKRKWAVAAIGLFIGIHFFTYEPWDPMVMNMGLYRQRQAALVPESESWSQYRNALAGSGLKLRRVHEGHSTTVAIFQEGETFLSMRINGKVDASLGDEFSQRMTSHLPLLAHPDPRDGLVIGLGIGSTAAAMEGHGLNRVDVVELHPEVVAGSRAFDPYTGGILSRPRVKLYLDDALHFLRVNGSQYDVIASEPTNPWQSGVGNLFSQEYYRLISARLKEGGILSQWVHTYEISDEVVYILLRTITSVFPHVELFQMRMYDFIVLASHQPIRPRFDLLEERLNHPPIKKSLEDLGITTPAAIASLHIAAAEDLKRMIPPGRLNYLDYPVVEFKAPEPFFRRIYSSLFEKLDTRFAFRPTPGLWWNQLFDHRSADNRELRSIRESALKAYNQRVLGVANKALVRQEAWERLPEDLGSIRWREGEAGRACQLLGSSKTISKERLAGAYQEEKRYFLEARSVFSRPDPGCLIYLAGRLLEMDEKNKHIWQRELGIWLWVQGGQKESIGLLRSWFDIRPMERWNEDDIRALHILVRGGMAARQGAALDRALRALEIMQRWPEDFLAVAEAREFLHNQKMAQSASPRRP